MRWQLATVRSCVAHLDNLEALAGLALAVGDRDVRQQRRVADDRRQRVAVLVGRPLADTLALCRAFWSYALFGHVRMSGTGVASVNCGRLANVTQPERLARLSVEPSKTPLTLLKRLVGCVPQLRLSVSFVSNPGNSP